MSRPRRRRPRRRRRAISLTDVLVVLVLLGLLFAIWAPVVSNAQSRSVRYRCANHLNVLFNAFQNYRNMNGGRFPRTLYVEGAPPDVSSIGAAANDPFKPGGPPANNVPAALFLLLRTQDTSPRHFTCPGGSFDPDPTGDVDPSLRSNFTDVKRNLGYSFVYPYTRAFSQPIAGPRGSVLLADVNPGIKGAGDDMRLRPNDPPDTLRRGNSNNHRKSGQNVLFDDGHWDFRPTPFLGTDNIYATDGGSVTEAPKDGDVLLLPTDD
jgi:type II secretory pathway pseudopilin PulG